MALPEAGPAKAGHSTEPVTPLCINHKQKNVRNRTKTNRSKCILSLRSDIFPLNSNIEIAASFSF